MSEEFKKFVRVVDLPHIPVTVMVVITNDIEKARNEAFVVDAVGSNFTGFEADGLCTFEKGSGFIFLKEDSTPSTIAHECFHMVYHIMDHLSTPLGEDSNEMFAYHVGYLVKEANLSINKYKLDKIGSKAIVIHYDFVDGTELPYSKAKKAKGGFTTNCLEFFNADNPNAVVVREDGSSMSVKHLLSAKHNHSTKEIRPEHNLHKMLVAGLFKW